MVSALVGVFMLMAYGTGGNKLSLEIGLDCSFGITLDTNDYLNTSFIEDIYGSSSHTA